MAACSSAVAQPSPVERPGTTAQPGVLVTSGGASAAAPALISTTVVRNGRGVKYSLWRSAEVGMELFDVSGRRLASRGPTLQSSGDHTLGWDEVNAPSGVYFLRLRVDGQTHTTPVVRTSR
jgi:hypothetical protein